MPTEKRSAVEQGITKVGLRLVKMKLGIKIGILTVRRLMLVIRAGIG